MIRKVEKKDIPAITSMYNYYIRETVITFNTQPVGEKDMEKQMLAITSAYPYLVDEEEGEVRGYCYVHPWKSKEAYRHTVECTIYLHPAWRGKGIGRQLLNALLEQVKQTTDIRVVLSCITLPNEPSVRLHERAGFRQVSCFREVGYKFNRWLDVGDWQITLARPTLPNVCTTKIHAEENPDS